MTEEQRAETSRYLARVIPKICAILDAGKNANSAYERTEQVLHARDEAITEIWRK